MGNIYHGVAKCKIAEILLQDFHSNFWALLYISQAPVSTFLDHSDLQNLSMDNANFGQRW